MSASPDVLFALLERVEGHLREAAREIRALSERVTKLETQRDADSESRHRLANKATAAIGRLESDLEELARALEASATASQTVPALSEKEQRSATVLTWLGENYALIAAIIALIVAVASAFGVRVVGIGEAPTVRDELRAEHDDGIAPGDSFTYGSD